MQQVSVTINGRAYPVACDEGDEERIQALARMIDGKVGNFARQVGQAGEARLLVLAALVLADELAEAKEALQHTPGGRAEAGESKAIASGVERLAARVEAVAAKLESAHI